MISFEPQDCPTCGVRFGVPTGYTAHRRNDKATFYCPNGHSIVYKKSEADKLRETLEAKERELQRAKQNEAWYEQRIEGHKRAAAAARGQVTKLKNRAAAGVCPCCNRTFQNLQRHMASKHKGFLHEPVQGEHGEVVQ